jgi:hypothetical protein
MIPYIDETDFVVCYIVIGALEQSPRYVDIGLDRAMRVS